jgi:2-octaprenyl-6-methoxyphenol hydroxylase
MYDVVIIGGGMVGATVACGLAPTGLSIALVDARHPSEFAHDGRASAIAYGSAQIWQSMGVWSAMERRGVNPMQTIRVTDGDYPLAVYLNSQEMERPALGFVVENAVSQAALWEMIRSCPRITTIVDELVSIEEQTESLQINLQHQTLTARLLVGADGAKSKVRQLAQFPSYTKTYTQTCIVITVQLANSHQQIAYECFQTAGPFALLPLTNDRFCIVWTASQSEAPQLLALSPEDFLATLKERIGDKLLAQFGEVSILSAQPAHYQPRWQHSFRYCRERIVLVGDAAHTTHPIAGQGVNLGLRDAAVLTQVLQEALAQQKDIGSLTVLHRYQHRRYWDNLGTILATDLTNQLFSNQLIICQGIRRLGLHLFNTVTPLRKLLMFLAMGLHHIPYTYPTPPTVSQPDNAVHSLL